MGIFLQYLLWEPGWATEGKSYSIMGASLLMGRLGVFNIQTCLHWTFSNLSIIFQTSYACTGSCDHFSLWVPALVSHDEYSCLFFPYGGILLSVSSISKGSKKGCWLFSLFSFLLIKTEWQLSSPLHVKPEIGNLKYFFTMKMGR